MDIYAGGFASRCDSCSLGCNFLWLLWGHMESFAKWVPATMMNSGQ